MSLIGMALVMKCNALFSLTTYGLINIDIAFNRTIIPSEPIQLDLPHNYFSIDIDLVYFMLGLNVIRRPEDQFIYRGQNAFFHCLLNGTDGKLIPVQWSISEDGPSENITMNSTEYLILPPANSVLVLVKPSFDLFVECRGGIGVFDAGLGVLGKGKSFLIYYLHKYYIGLPNCNVDNGNCEDSCIESNCFCSNNQRLIRTSCVCKFSVYIGKHYCM